MVVVIVAAAAADHDQRRVSLSKDHRRFVVLYIFVYFLIYCDSILFSYIMQLR